MSLLVMGSSVAAAILTIRELPAVGKPSCGSRPQDAPGRRAAPPAEPGETADYRSANRPSRVGAMSTEATRAMTRFMATSGYWLMRASPPLLASGVDAL